MHSRQHTIHSWFAEPCRVNGISFLITLNFLTLWMVHSTRILTDAIFWLSFTSAAINCALPPRKEGIFKSTLNPFKPLSMVKPRSAITLSRGDQSSFPNMPDFVTISLSKTEPSYSWLRNVIEPERETHQLNLYMWHDFCSASITNFGWKGRTVFDKKLPCNLICIE